MQVSKWGNSLAIRLPKKLVEDMGIVDGDELAVVDAANGRFALEKIDRRAQFLKATEQFHFPLPEDWKFDRDEANER